MPEREGREYLSWSQEHRKKHSVHRSSHLAPDSYLIHLPIHDFFLQDIVNKSLTLSRLLGFPLLWILQGNTLCQFNQLSLTVFRWSQYPDDRLKHPSSPSWFLQVGLWNLSKAKPIFFCLHTIFFFCSNGDKLFPNTRDTRDTPFKCKVLVSFSALIQAAWKKQIICILNSTALQLCKCKQS